MRLRCGGSRRFEGLDGLTQPGVRIAVAAPGTPLAALTEQALARLDPVVAAALRAHFALHDPDASVLLSHVDLGEADAAFVYQTDLARWPDERTIDLPAAASLTANRYVIAELAGAAPASAPLVDYLLGDTARRAFVAAGFRPVTAAAPAAAATASP